MMKKEVESFVNAFPVKKNSPAQLEYMMFDMPELRDAAVEIASAYTKESPEDEEIRKSIEVAEDPNGLLKLMKKQLTAANKNLLRKKVLERQEEMLPLIKEKTLRYRQDAFAENALYFYLRNDENCAPWIFEHYDEIAGEYMKSMLCLVIGFRGDTSMISKMMEEVVRFVKVFPRNDYEQGPLLAVKKLGEKM